MSDNTTLDPQTQQDPAPSAETKNTESRGPVPYDRFKEVIDLKATLEQRIARMEADEKRRTDEAQKAAEAKMEADREWEKLAVQHKAKLDELSPKAALAESLLKRVEAANQARIEKMPENLRSLVPAGYDHLQLSEWLDANLDKLTAPKPPNLDGGQRGDRDKTPVEVTLKPASW